MTSDRKVVVKDLNKVKDCFFFDATTDLVSELAGCIFIFFGFVQLGLGPVAFVNLLLPPPS